jgi:hypothetical protein
VVKAEVFLAEQTPKQLPWRASLLGVSLHCLIDVALLTRTICRRDPLLFLAPLSQEI